MPTVGVTGDPEGLSAVREEGVWVLLMTNGTNLATDKVWLLMLQVSTKEEKGVILLMVNTVSRSAAAAGGGSC